MTAPGNTRRTFLKSLGAGAAALALPRCVTYDEEPAEGRAPNIVIIFTDDQGYADVGVYGAEGFETPHLDAMAADGVRFTDFYVAQPVCGGSRAALLTGCYPNRIGLSGVPDHTSRYGIAAGEMTIAEVLKQRGYATAAFGKWHLGHLPQFLPMRHGFDEYFGLPYSNDMWPHHPTAKGYYPDLPLVEGEDVIELNPDQTKLTTWYTERAVRFIEMNKDRPFFLYLPHAMAHVPLAVSDKFKGKSEQGLYGDVIMEIDWSVGRIMEAVRKAGVDEHTLFIFASDNGPWLSYGNHAGSAGPLREGKGTTWEGGVRVPCIMRWKGRIPAGTVCREPAMTIDLLPTVAAAAGASLPAHGVDGRDIGPLMRGEPGARCPHEAFTFYLGENNLEALRSGKWKLVFPHTYAALTGEPGKDGRPNGYSRKECGLELYDLENDIGEREDVAAAKPDVVERLRFLAEQARDDLGDGLTGREGRNIRPSGRI